MNYICTKCGRMAATGIRVTTLSCRCGRIMVEYEPVQLELWQDVKKKIKLHEEKRSETGKSA